MSKKKQSRARPPQPKSTALLCALVSETEGAPDVHSRVDTCSGGCGKAVWRALSSHPKVRAICRNCLLRDVQFSGAENIAVVPPSKKQRVDIATAAELRKRYGG